MYYNILYTKHQQTENIMSKLTDIQEQITTSVINGLSTYKKWIPSFQAGGLPRSIGTGNAYTGVNTLLLMFAGFGSPYFGTYKAWKATGSFVKKGQKATRIIFFKPVFCKENPEEIKYMNTKIYSVFNIEQVELSEEAKAKFEIKDGVKAEGSLLDYFNHSDAPQLVTGAPAYRPLSDTISIPSNFKTSEAAVSVLAHEIVHSTGAKSRLNRDGVANFDKFGSHQYSYEELIAELGAMFICAELGANSEDVKENSQAYINSWIKKLEENPTWIYKASKEASKAVEYIMTRIEKKEIAAA